MWEPMQGVRCILRPPRPLVCLGLLVVHLGGPLGQIAGKEVGKVMEGHGSIRDYIFTTHMHVCAALKMG